MFVSHTKIQSDESKKSSLKENFNFSESLTDRRGLVLDLIIDVDCWCRCWGLIGNDGSGG